ncbi:MAG TPA: hypothetical protein VLY65_01345 [Nitrososphaerales archaeon]|nr:hypothetical protein [Nitrososphaerales archaeon]
MGKYNDEARLREQVGLLIQSLRSDSDGTRESAIVQLSLLGSKAAPQLTSTLLAALEERERGASLHPGTERAIEGIVRALGMIADPPCAAALAKALPMPEAAMALGKLGTSTALGLLIQEIPKWYVRPNPLGSGPEEKQELARRAFSYFGQEAVTKLVEAAKGSSVPVGLCACVVFQEAKSASSVSGLLDLLESAELSVRTASFRSLAKLGAPIPQQFVTRALLGTLKSSTEMVVGLPLEQVLEAADEDTLLRFYFGFEWEATGASEGRRLMERYIARKGSDVVPKLITYVEAGTPNERALAARLLEKATSLEPQIPGQEEVEVAPATEGQAT